MSRSYIAAIFGGVVCLWALSWVVVVCLNGPPDGAGTFGDMFGAVNALFSGFAFAGIVITLILQQNEIKEQQREVAIQRFEAAFHSLLSIHEQRISSYDFEGKKGRAVFNDVVSEITRFAKDVDLAPVEGAINDNITILRNNFRTYIKIELKQILLSHFSNINSIVKHIHNSKALKLKDKSSFYEIILSSMSFNERLIVSYYFPVMDVDFSKDIRRLDNETSFYHSVQKFYFHPSHKPSFERWWHAED